MKKSVALVLCLVLVFSMFSLTGCGTEKAPYDYDLSEYIVLGSYEGVDISKMPEIEITAEQIQAEIQSKLAAAKTKEAVKEGVVADGDTVNIDFEGKMDGEAFQGGSAKGTDLDIGSHMFIDGFETGLIGHSVGETVVLDLTFPDPYPNNPELANKPVEFTVKINSLMVDKAMDYDIDFVKSQGFESLDAYEKNIDDELYKKAEDEANYNREQEVWTKIVEASEVKKYPEAELKEIKAEYRKMCESYMANYGYTFDDYLKMNGITEEDFNKDAQKYAENVCKNEMVLFAIAHEQNMEVSKDEYNAFVEKTVKEQGFESVKDFEKASGTKFEDTVSRRTVISSALLEKVMDYIFSKTVEK